MLPELLDQIPPEQEIASVTADGAFDTRKCHDAIAARGAAAIIPPRKNAKPWKPDTAGAIARNEILGIEGCRSDNLATMGRVSPSKPRRDQDALRQAPCPAPVRARVRPSGRRVPRPCRRPERLHRTRHPRHRSRGVSLSGERGTLSVTRFVQQSPSTSIIIAWSLCAGLEEVSSQIERQAVEWRVSSHAQQEPEMSREGYVYFERQIGLHRMQARTLFRGRSKP